MPERKVRLFLFVFLLLAVTLLLNSSFAQPPPSKPSSPESQAQEQYERFLAIYRQPSPSASDLKKALDFVATAQNLSPKTYKYSFSLGSVNYALGRYGDAVKWYNQAQTLANTEDQKKDIKPILDDCYAQLSKEKVKSWGNPGISISFIMKEGTVEMDRNTLAKLPQRLPGIGIRDPVQPVVQALTQKVPGIRVIQKDVFLVAGYEDETRLERHYERGIKDFYRYFKKQYFPHDPKRPIVAIIAPSPEPLIKATEQLYPDVKIPKYAPFLGYYNPADNLIMATGGDTGYGTLLHELIHALMASDFPEAPLWLNEGLGSLYERTRWTHDRLEPLPNWRMDVLKEDRVGSLGEIASLAERPDVHLQEIAKIRLLFLFLDQKRLIVDLYSWAKENPGKSSLSEPLSKFQLTESSWQEFIRNTFRDYRAEISSGQAQLTNPEEVRFVQEALNQVMQSSLKVDGFWGPGTEAKLIEFQRRFHLAPDGQVGPKTKAELKRQFTLHRLKALEAPK